MNRQSGLLPPTDITGAGYRLYDVTALTENIDKAGKEGTARFAAEAIKIYCG